MPAKSFGAVRRSLTGSLALVMAGGCGTRLGPLTARRAKPAMPIAGDFHLIDFTLSNCVNSGLSEVGVLTQYLAGSLRPVVAAWANMAQACEFHVLAGGDHGAYTGTADAVWQNCDLIKNTSPSEVIILAADHIYAMDYGAMVEAHRGHGAPVTIGVVEVPASQTRELGIMTVKHDGYVDAFVEKPLRPLAGTGHSDVVVASMGIYVFNSQFLLDALARDAASAVSRHDFGHDVIPAALSKGVFAYRFYSRTRPFESGYWRDVGTLDAYWRANMELAGGSTAPMDLNDPEWPFFGSLAAIRRRESAGERRETAMARGCIGRDVTIVNSVIHPGVRIGPGSHIEECVLLPGATIGANCFLRRAILDGGIWLQHGSIIGADPVADRRRHHVTEQGIVLITDFICSGDSSSRHTGDRVTPHSEMPSQISAV